MHNTIHNTIVQTVHVSKFLHWALKNYITISSSRPQWDGNKNAFFFFFFAKQSVCD